MTTVESTVDVAHMRRVLTYIQTHPDEWNQNSYGETLASGKSRGCFAYHTLALRGGYEFRKSAPPAARAGALYGSAYVHAVGADLESIEVAAARELGIDLSEAEDLFQYDNTLDELEELVDLYDRNG